MSASILLCSCTSLYVSVFLNVKICAGSILIPKTIYRQPCSVHPSMNHILGNVRIMTIPPAPFYLAPPQSAAYDCIARNFVFSILTQIFCMSNYIVGTLEKSYYKNYICSHWVINFIPNFNFRQPQASFLTYQCSHHPKPYAPSVTFGYLVTLFCINTSMIQMSLREKAMHQAA